LANFYQDPVQVSVSLSTSALETEAFETPLFIVPHNVYSSTRIQSYSSLDALTDAGFAVGSAPYRFATLAFGGKFPPSLIKIGRAPLTAYTVDFTGFTQTEDQTITLTNGTTTKSFTHTYSANDTPTIIATAFVTLITADTTFNALVTATNTAGKLIISPKVATTPISVGVQAGAVVLSATSTETPTDTYEACKDEDTDFFWVAAQDHNATKQQTLAASVSADKKIFVYATQDANVKLKANTTNIFALMKAAAYDWVIGMYHEKADMVFPEGAIIGATAGINFDEYGADSLHLKTLSGLTVSNLTTTDREAIEFHNGNYAITYRGNGCLFNGYMASGQFCDTMKFAAWLDARITESVFGLMYRASNAGKSMTFSNNDLPRIKNAIFNSPINVGLRNGSILDGIDPSTGENFEPTVTIPTRGEVPTNDLANRVLNDVEVEVIYNNPLHYVSIKANVLLSRQA
jgi:hypothetical protein